MAPNVVGEPAAATNGEGAGDTALVGPPAGLAPNPLPYISELELRRMLSSVGHDEAREDSHRLKGVELIDTVRQNLQLPVKTFDTAVTYYHRCRIIFPSAEYNYDEVALACLFLACKSEDTLKKSKEILCAAHNTKSPQDQKQSDDKAFEATSRVIVGLERHILETIGFDFRVQYPQKLLIKLVRKLYPQNDEQSAGKGREFLRVAYDMSIDMYKTFAPIKQSSYTLVMAIIELTALITDTSPEKMEQIKGLSSHTTRPDILETILDLLDLYTHSTKVTKVGPRFDLTKLMDVKIAINKQVSAEGYQRYNGWCDTCAQEVQDPVTPSSAVRSPATNNSFQAKRNGKGSEMTLRYVFDAKEAKREQELVDEYFNDEYEEVTVEVEETIKEPEPRHSSHRPSNHNSHRSNHGHGHGHGGHNGHGWGPYPRSRHDDRHRSGRRGHGY